MGGTAGHADEVRRLFDAKAAGWPAKYAPGGPLTGRLTNLSAVVSRFAGPGDRVLDLGCGTGELAFALAATGVRMVGCDTSGQMLRHAPRAARRPAGWVQLDPHWRSLPFRPEAFDAVVAASVLEYLDEPAVFLAESARVLRPEGVVVCTVPNLGHPVRWLEAIARAATRVVPVPDGGGGRSRWARYRLYLRASRNRHCTRWWLAAAEQAGLCPLPLPAEGGHSPLRTLAFRSASERQDLR
jgi:SAM-dependent methyltransferase